MVEPKKEKKTGVGGLQGKFRSKDIEWCIRVDRKQEGESDDNVWCLVWNWTRIRMRVESHVSRSLYDGL